MTMVILPNNNYMLYDHIQGKRSIVIYDTDLNLYDCDSQNEVRPNLLFKLM